MRLLIESAEKDLFGMYEIKVRINNKRYTYQLSSQDAYDRTMKQYRLGQHGRCLALLNKYKEAI